MGSPLSPVIANLYMEHLEENALQTAPLPPRLWLRYVDDAFVICPHGQDELQRFHEHLNGQHPNIKFTIKHDPTPFVCRSNEPLPDYSQLHFKNIVWPIKRNGIVNVDVILT